MARRRYGGYQLNDYNSMGNYGQKQRGVYNDFMNMKNSETEGGYNAEVVGMGGEHTLNQVLKSLPEYYHVMPDLLLKTKTATTQLDHVVVSPFGIFVIETKNMKGMLFGSQFGKVWTQTFLNGQRHTIYNPLKQNEGHIRAVCDNLRIPRQYVIGLIALTNPDVDIRNLQCQGVYKVEDLYRAILYYNQVILDEQHVLKAIRIFDKKNINGYENIQKHKKYVASLKGGKSQVAIEREKTNKAIQREQGYNRW